MEDKIIVRGAREHNLKNVSITIPRDKLVVFTGLSGSGKSSLAFDTIYAEGQRRYVESMSSYARMFLGQMDKPDVDSIEGLSPAISIDQKTTARNPRSTVGTVTEIHDYLRLLYARTGKPHCPNCGKEIKQQTVDQMVDAITALPEGTKLQILAPVVRSRKGEHTKLLEDARKSGFVRVRIDGDMYELDETPALDKQKKHQIDLVVDRLVVRDGIQQRLTDSLETAMKQSGGLASALLTDGQEMMFSQNYACPDCGVNIEELAPRMFSFNNPYGACPACSGLGELMKVSADLVVPDPTKTLNEGAVSCMGWNSGEANSTAHSMFQAMADYYGFSMDTPYMDLPEDVKQKILYGTGAQKLKINFETGTYQTTFEGVIPSLERRYAETQSEGMKAAYEEYMAHETCPVCKGRRLKPEALAVTVGEKNIAEISEWNIKKAKYFLDSLSLSEKDSMIAAPILREVDARLGFLCDVGLDYLTLSRAAATLSGGEAQRIRLATQIGSGL
ncbi:MAG: excinuclease ABC subunit UvrA, partial [Clostridia bacterium]|nr:excinuclease ABC subunit UvrA [Clostridia bacterium]